MKPYCIQLTPLRMYARNSAAKPFSATLRFPAQKKVSPMWRKRIDNWVSLARAVRPVNAPSRQQQAPDNSLDTPNPKAVWSEATILIGAAVVTTALPFFPLVNL